VKTCAGEGVVVSEATAVVDAERKLRALAASKPRTKGFKVELNAHVAELLIGPGAVRLGEMEHFATTFKRVFFEKDAAGEAVAVRHDGRANPNQLVLSERTAGAVARLRQSLVDAHVERFGSDRGLVVGLQLTHSGRYARPDVYDRPAPLAACTHPLLDRRFPAGVRVLSDAELDTLVDDFAAAARLARDAGFRFVDVKACHGYLGHELLGARTRTGPYGGALENRARLLLEVVRAVRDAVGSDFHLQVKISATERANAFLFWLGRGNAIAS